MRSKVTIRKLIDYYKNEYSRDKDKDMLIYIAILKGMYIALGGKKGIPLNANLDFIVKLSKILFSYEHKIMTSKPENVIKAHLWLDEELRKIGIYTGSITNIMYNNTFNSIVICSLLSELVCREYGEDLFINNNKIYNIALDIISKTKIS